MLLRQKISKTIDNWEDRANQVLKLFKYTFPDEIDMGAICYKFGIKIKPMPFGDPSLSYSQITRGRRGIIYIKSGMDPIEKKIVLAEEFAHIYSHTQHQLEVPEIDINKIEFQAKKMAAYLLMPSKLLGEVYVTACQLTDAVLVTEIADHFLVTEEFAMYRLELAFGHPVHGISKLPDGSLATIQMFEE
ncbi:ImmA/IrrE family metallo-endopeptidase [Geomicrobium sediminis]|uniref:Zn-dependent peptidase ImmA (M78 family) n=1 Tax=Geomicrobium sediminis TaxID=1347788 RepID=A0ABS2PEP1_9BACL|nr:ImmA/IrrE family metallo-endopeptidase [Geomicrobium sediminis]MBM7633878.1 Zn-dependent peptidase ImmA (M78 family) [Geomicrobium sediminis]